MSKTPPSADMIVIRPPCSASSEPTASACRLTLDLLSADGWGSDGGLADVVAGSALPVVDPRWASGPGMSGVRCACRRGGLRVQGAKSAANPRGGQPLDRQRPFPGAAQIVRERAGEAQLGVRGEDQPGPAVGRGRATQPRAGPAQGLLGEADGVLEVEAAQVGLLAASDRVGVGAGRRGPE